MAWWKRILGWRAEASLRGLEYRIAFTLYSKDASRKVEIRQFSNGKTYMLEQEAEGETFKDRHSGSMVGPFASPEAAERFIIATPWFRGED